MIFVQENLLPDFSQLGRYGGGIIIVKVKYTTAAAWTFTSNIQAHSYHESVSMCSIKNFHPGVLPVICAPCPKRVGSMMC